MLNVSTLVGANSAHCYASAKANPADGKLTGAETRAFLDDLAEFGVPAVLPSGGVPWCGATSSTCWSTAASAACV